MVFKYRAGCQLTGGEASYAWVTSAKKARSIDYARRSTVEVNPKISEAPYLRGYITDPKPDSAKMKLHPENIPIWPLVYKNAIFSNKIVALRRV